MTIVEMSRNWNESSGSGTRASLIARVRHHEASAWDELVELYGPLIAHWCYRFDLDSHTTADCVQEVFGAIFRAIPNYQALNRHGAFRGWLWTITRNKVRDQLRRQRAQSTPQGGTSAMVRLSEIPDIDELSDEEPSSPAELQSLAARAFDQIRSEFETRSLAIFTRSVIDQVATPLVASEFQVQPATVRQVRSRILRRLRQQLGDLGP
jgi:RNA polymerase sigma-70 factor, ECF subfamily